MEKDKINKHDEDVVLHSETEDVAPETRDDENLEDAIMSAEEEENVEKDDLAIELEKTRAELEKEKKEYLFLMAEFDNFRKRSLRERSELIKNAAESVMKGLLPIVDDFERGLQMASGTDGTDGTNAILEGMQLIYNKLVKYLEQNGVKPMQTDGEPFDADMHEAMAMVPAQSEEQKGMIIDTLEKGYTINDKVLRHAKVAVAQ